MRIKNAQYAVGQRIDVKQPAQQSRTKLVARAAALAACCMLVCGLSLGAYAYLNPAYYVSMDVNPSVAYTLNTFDRVLSVQAMNEDGTRILQAMNLKNLNNKTIDEAMTLTLAEITREGYFDGNVPGGIVIATSGKKEDSAQQLAIHLKELVSSRCADNRRAVSVEAMAVGQAQMQEAKSLGVTPGKLLLVQALLAEHPESHLLSIEEWLQKPVKDIIAALDHEEDADDLLDDADDVREAAAEAAKDAAEKAKDELEEAKDAAEKAKDEAKDELEKAKDAAEKAKDEAKDELEKAKDAAAEKAKDELEKAKDAAEKAKDELEKAIEWEEDDKPVISVHPVTPGKDPTPNLPSKPVAPPEPDESEEPYEPEKSAPEEHSEPGGSDSADSAVDTTAADTSLDTGTADAGSAGTGAAQ
ncbi:MAG: hypothetical protein RR320_00265 [Oscillospiraceae bacterium]